MTRFGIDGGDDAILGDSARDGKDAVVALREILTEDGRKQLRGGASASVELALMEHGERGETVLCECVDQRFARLRVVPFTGRFPRLLVVVIAAERQPDSGRQVAIND